MKKSTKRPSNANATERGRKLALWINEQRMTTRFQSALSAAFAFCVARGTAKRQAQQRLNESLKAFPFVPAVVLAGRGGCLVVWRDSGVPRKTMKETLEVIDSGDIDSCRTLVKLLELGKVEALRRCVCGKWFFAGRKNQVSCSPVCRKSKHETTQAYKEKRRAYRRGLYESAKKRDELNLRTVTSPPRSGR